VSAAAFTSEVRSYCDGVNDLAYKKKYPNQVKFLKVFKGLHLKIMTARDFLNSEEEDGISIVVWLF
jgi:hypothetical protein